VDDPIASALRQAQAELRVVLARNKARKARLAAIAEDRLGYQEYLELRDSLDRNIITLYQKLQRKEGPKSAKKKSHKKGAAAAAAAEEAQAQALNAAAAAGVWPASLGLGPDEDNTLIVPEQLRQLIETRKKWIDTIGMVFEEKEREQPGRIHGLPERSVYEGIEDDVAMILDRLGDPGLISNSQQTQMPPLTNGVHVSGKGKARVGVDDAGMG
jgi:transcriptional adapter 3